MASEQWIVCTRYGSQNIAIAGTSSVTTLMQTQGYADIDPDALETAPQEDFLVKRIVGQIFVSTVQTPANDLRIGWRLMMLPLDLTAGTVETPWPAGSAIMLDPDIANEPRWWGERYYTTTSIGGGEDHGLSVIDNPWWTHVDLHPNEIGGPGAFGGNMYPVLVMDNTQNIEDLTFRHRLRMYVKTMGRK